MALRPSSQKYSEGNCQNVEISKLKTSTSTTLEKTNSKLCRNLHFATAKKTFCKNALRKWLHFSANFETSKWQFRYSEKHIWQKKSETARAVSGPEGYFCHSTMEMSSPCMSSIVYGSKLRRHHLCLKHLKTLYKYEYLWVVSRPIKFMIKKWESVCKRAQLSFQIRNKKKNTWRFLLREFSYKVGF